MVTIAGSNDGPVLSLESGDSAAETIAETDAELTESGTVTLADVDTDNTVSTTIAFVSTSGDANAITASTFGDMMSVTGGLDNSENSDQIIWNFGSDGEAFDYLGVNDTLAITYRITASDGTASTTQDVVITITGTNDDPVASNVSFTVTENDAAVTGNVLTGAYSAGGNSGGATDVDGDSLTVTNLVNNSTNVNAPAVILGTPTTFAVGGAASYQLNSDGSYAFDPSTGFDNLAAGEQRTFSVTQTISDPNGGSDTATTTLTVTGVNDAPVAAAEAGSTTSAVQTSGQLDATDVDIGTGSLAYSLAIGPASGTATVSNTGIYTYTSNVGFSGTDTFTYSVSDGALSDTETVSITVAPPAGTIANDDTFEIDATSTLNSVGTGLVPDGYGGFAWNSSQPAAGASNPDIYFGTQSGRTYVYGGNLGLQTDITTIGGGEIDLVGLSFHSYGPNPAYIAQYSATSVSVLGFKNGVQTYSQAGIAVGAVTNYVTLNFNDIDAFRILATGGVGLVEIDDITTGTGASTIIDEDVVQTIDTAGLLSNDTDALGGTLSITAVSASSANGAAITLNGNGTISYDPTNAPSVQALLNGQTLTDTFTYTITSAPGGTMDTATVSLVVTGNGANDAPVADEAGITVTEDMSISGQLAATDPQGTVLTYSVTATAGNGTLVLNSNGSYTYTPNADFSGADSFTYSVTDGALSDTGTVGITVDAVNDAPIFGVGDGIVTTDVGGNDAGRDALLLPDGKILVLAGIGGGYENTILRYLPDGTLDTSFAGGTGFVTTPNTFPLGGPRALATQSDGSILAVGYATQNIGGSANPSFSLVRFSADGAFDTSFAAGAGAAIERVGLNATYGHDVQVLADDSIIVTGYRNGAGGNKYLVAMKFTSAGVLDPLFGSGGIAEAGIGSAQISEVSSAVLGDGSILVAGDRYTGADSEFVVVKFDSVGAVDTGFGTLGTATFSSPITSERHYSMIVQPNGKILIGGSQLENGVTEIAVARMLADGSIDTSFGGGDGIVTTAVGAVLDAAYDIKLQTDGKIIAIGTSQNTSGDYEIAIVRYTADGVIDTTFGGGDGIVVFPLGTNAIAYTTVIQPDGQIIVLGQGNAGADADIVLLRIDANGNLDSSFDAVNGLGGNVAYTEGEAPVFLDTDVVVNDADLDALNGGNGDYAGSSLTVARTGGADAQDVFAIDATGKSFTVSGGNLQAGGQTFATFTSTGGTLSIAFTSSAVTATSALAAEVLQSVTYANTAGTGTPATVDTAWTFNDGGGATVTGTVTVNVTATASAPTLSVVEPPSESNDLQVSSLTGAQSDQAITALTDGNYVITWTEGGSGDVKARIIDKDGAPVSAEFFANPSVQGNGIQNDTSVTDLDDGFVITYTGDQTGSSDVYFQRFDNSGTPVGGQVDVATTGTQPQESHVTTIFNANDEVDGFVVVWNAILPVSGGSTYDIIGQRYDVNGGAVGSNFVINTTAEPNDYNAIVTGFADGGFGVAWRVADGISSANTGFKYQQFDTTAAPTATPAMVGGEIAIFSPDAFSQSLTMLENGDILAVWNSAGGTLSGQLFANGGSAGAAFTIASGGTALEPSVTPLADGGFFVVWNATDGNGSGVFGQKYSVSGFIASTVDSVIQINQGTVGDQVTGRENGGQVVTELDDGSIAVSWTSGSVVGGTSDIFTRIVSKGALEEDVAFALPITAALTDTDGSETLNVEISNLPTGFIVSDGTNTATSDGTNPVNVTAFNRADITITPVSGFTGQIVVTATSTESANGATSSATQNIDLTIVEVNDAPVATPSSGNVDYTRGDGAVAIDSGLTITDVDSTTLMGATVSISANHASNEDNLGFVNQLGIAGSYNPLTGVLTLSGVASLADYQSALRSITYRNISDPADAPSTLQRTISFTLEDSTSTTSTVSTRLIDVSLPDAVLTGTIGNDGDPLLTGGILNDVIFGLDGDDALIGGLGNDVLIGGGGGDTLTGGGGTDEFVLGDFLGSPDSIVDYEVGIDTINVEAIISGMFNPATDIFAEANGSVTSLFVQNQLVATMPSDLSGQNLEVIYDSSLAAAQVTVSLGGGFM
ncbi:tandem-95 repeat protein [Ahrensia sp. AH-315-G08]|nr:tandem-95 repeat protein [Ahrensia sp. AH-315-G08]